MTIYNFWVAFTASDKAMVAEQFQNFIKSLEYILGGITSHHFYAVWFEVGYAFKIIGIMTAGFKNTQFFTFPINGHLQMSSGSIYAFLHGWWRQMFSGFNKVFHFFKKPRITNTRPANHRTVQPVFIAHFNGAFWGVDIAISKNRNVHSGIVFYFGNQRPIGISFIHLNACSAVNGNGLTAHILKAFGNFNNPNCFLIPAQAGFYGNRYIGALHHSFSELDHQ